LILKKISKRKKMKTKILISVFLVLFSFVAADTNFRLMSYNALNFDGADRITYFETVFAEANPDIVVMQEMESSAGCDAMLGALNSAIGGFARATFVYDSGLQNMLFYKTAVASLTSQDEVTASPRVVSEYVLQIDGNPLRVYSCHLKASDTTTDEATRLTAVTALRNHLNALASGTEFVIAGDMNFYRSSEDGYAKFIASEANNIGRADDLCTEVGSWHNNSFYADVHTQCPRLTSFGGGSSGGMDDKFDFIFSNEGMNNSSGIEFSTGTFTSFGNDGDHYNISINSGTNNAVPANVADALYYASDHIPVYADFTSLSGGSPPTGSLIISEYIEGSSNNKAIEIYNGTGNSVDLSLYTLQKDVNGDEVWGNTYSYSGTLADGEVYIVANSLSDPIILSEANDTNNGVILFNGDDQIRLLKSGVEVDRIGIPGDITFGADVTFVRNSDVTDPRSGAQDPRSNGEWTSYASDTFTYLGAHTQDGPANVPPEITNIQHSPVSPTSSQTVSVSADVTDTDGTVSSASLIWGLVSGSLTNSINMTFVSGDSYEADTDIPAQSDGTTVYYQVSATDDDSDTTTSSEYSYTVSDTPNDPTPGDLLITEICGDGTDGDNGNDNGFMEVWNSTTSTLSLSNVQARYYNTNPNNPTATINLSGTIAADEYIIVTQDAAEFLITYGLSADYSHNTFYFNGGDDGADIYLTTARAEVIDQFNDVGVGASPFTWSTNNYFERNTTETGSIETNWTEETSGTGSPGTGGDNPLPVTLSEFNAVQQEGSNFVSVAWITMSETNNLGWNIYRSSSEAYIQLNGELIEGAGTVTIPTFYQYSDENNLQPNSTYLYWLESVDISGNTSFNGPIPVYTSLFEQPEEETPIVPREFGLYQNQPNPFNPETKISFALQEDSVGDLVIYNLKGRKVKTLFEDMPIQSNKLYDFVWTGDDEFGKQAASGTYVYTLRTGEKTIQKRMILLK
jgi:predicted extracellular nuclease